MTIAYNNINFLVTITGIQNREKLFNTSQNVKKNISDIVYLNTLPNDAVKLAYVGSTELSVANNLYISDKSNELWGNSKTKDNIEFVSDTNPIGINTKNFLVTQIYTETGLEKIPLYFKYVFSESYNEILENSIKIFDKNFNEIPDNEYKIELVYNYNEDTGVKSTPSHYEIYNNLESSYSDLNGNFNIYYIQYTKVNQNINITTLLNNSPLYTEAAIEDIWHLTGNPMPWKNVYQLDTSGNLYITMSQNKTTYVKYVETKRIKLNYPIDITNLDGWNLRVTNGNFKSSYGPYVLNYEIKEFSNQGFNPYEPYRISANILCKKISNGIIKLPNENIQDGISFSYIDIIIKDQNDTEKYAITNNPYKNGQEYINFNGNRVYINNIALKWNSELFLGIDKYSGIVNVNINILDTDKIYSYYTYKEDSYTIKNINLNPIFDPNMASETRVVYLVPSNSPTNDSISSQIKSINWLKISKSGKILDTSQDGTDGNKKIDKNIGLVNTTGTSLDGIIGMYYNKTISTVSNNIIQEIYYNNEIFVSSTDGFPKTGWVRFVDNSNLSINNTGLIRYAKYIRKTNTSFILSGEELEVPDIDDGIFINANTTITLVNFINEFSTESSRDYNFEMNHRESISSVPIHCSRYFILGEVSVNLPHKPSDCILLDIRQNGGGIKQDKYLEAKYKNEKATWINDKNKYNGQLYPGNSVIVVKLPISIKEEFSEIQIKDIIEENIPLGIMPVVEYYGYKPEVISVLPISDIVESLGFGEGPFGEDVFGE